MFSQGLFLSAVAVVALTSCAPTSEEVLATPLPECQQLESGENIRLDSQCAVVAKPDSPVTVEAESAVQVVEVHGRKGQCKVSGPAKQVDVESGDIQDTYIVLYPGDVLTVEASSEPCEVRFRYKINV